MPPDTFLLPLRTEGDKFIPSLLCSDAPAVTAMMLLLCFPRIGKGVGAWVSLITSEGEHPFMYLLAVRISWVDFWFIAVIL